MAVSTFLHMETKKKRNRNYPKETCGITNLIRNNCSRSTLGLFHLRWFSLLILLQSQPRISDVEFAFACPRQNVIETTLKKRVASHQHRKKHRNENGPKVNLKQILELRFKVDSIPFPFTLLHTNKPEFAFPCLRERYRRNNVYLIVKQL